MPDGGKITISSEVEGDYVKISIKDEGAAFPKPIWQSSGSLSSQRKKKGRVLG